VKRFGDSGAADLYFFDAYGHRHYDRHGDADAHEAAQAGR
jgi:hypothetical protein